MPHGELGSKEAFESAIQEQGKYVLILAYNGTVHPKAEELADKFSATVSSYKVDVAKQEGASRGLGVGVEDAPAVVIYKDGSKVETFKGINAETGTKIAALLGA